MNAFYQLILLSVLAAAVYSAKPCPKAPDYVGKYIGPNCQCAYGVQVLCSYSGVTLGGTSKWVRGTNVRSLCDKGTPPPMYTPIATFLGPNNVYDHPTLKQHTAIFVSCAATGINVYDQYCNKLWGKRLITYSGKGDQNDAASMYTF